MWVSFSFIEQTFMMRPSYAKPWRETDSYLTCGHHPPSLGVFIICVEPNQVVTLVIINDYITSLTKRVHIEAWKTDTYVSVDTLDDVAAHLQCEVNGQNRDVSTPQWARLQSSN